MSDDMVTSRPRSRNLWKPGKANILKGLTALVFGAVLISVVVPAAAHAGGPSLAISRAGDNLVVNGDGFPHSSRGYLHAQLGNQNPVNQQFWTQSDGSFSATLDGLAANPHGYAVAKAWVRGTYAKASTDLSSATQSGRHSRWSKDGSTGYNGTGGSAQSSEGEGSNTTSTTSTTAAPVSNPTSTSAASSPSSSTSSPSKASGAKTTSTTVATKPSSVGNGSGFSDTPAGWKLAFSDDFTGTSLDRSKWGTYDGTGNAGIGTRSSKQVTVNNGELDITGNGSVAGGLMSNWSSTYGLYEIRARMDSASKGYNDALMVWPTGPWPQDGEIDMQEIYDGATNQMSEFAHWGSNNSQTGKTESGDFSQWHTIAVDWEPSSVTYYVDGQEVMTVTGAAVPSTPHTIAMQLDVASENGSRDNGAQLHVDWVKAYTKG
jgi:hypothetical protein